MSTDTPTEIDVDIDAIASAPTSDTPPKRGRGRPRGSTSSAGARGRPRSNAKVRELCAGVVGACNLTASFMPQYIPQEDLLNEVEMDALTNALTAEAMSSQRIVTWLSRAAKASAHLLLAQALIAIAIPRLQRRGILPRSTTDNEAMYNAFMAEAGRDYSARNASTETTVRMEAGSAPFVDGRYR